MNETDKLEISDLLNGLTHMAEKSNAENSVFVDKKTSKFCLECLKDYYANRDYIMDIVQKNVRLFINLDSCYKEWGGGDNFTINLGYGLHIYYSLVNPICIRADYFKGDDAIIKNCWWSISETKDPMYKYSSASDLIWHIHDKRADLHYIPDYTSPRSANEWKTLYCAATWTREKNRLIVDNFKKVLADKTKQFKSSADTAMESKRFLDSNVGEYVKVVA